MSGDATSSPMVVCLFLNCLNMSIIVLITGIVLSIDPKTTFLDYIRIDVFRIIRHFTACSRCSFLSHHNVLTQPKFASLQSPITKLPYQGAKHRRWAPSAEMQLGRATRYYILSTSTFL